MAVEAMAFTQSAETDAQRIVRGLRGRDVAILSELVERYQYRLARYLLYLTGRREFVEDLIQETWMLVLDRAGQFDGRGSFEAWLFTIARNRAMDYARRRKLVSVDMRVQRSVAEGFVGQVRPSDHSSAEHTSPFWVAARGEDALRLASAIDHLAPIYREALLLRFQEDLSLREIAGIVDASVSTVSSRIQRGLDILRSQLDGNANAL